MSLKYIKPLIVIIICLISFLLLNKNSRIIGHSLFERDENSFKVIYQSKKKVGVGSNFYFVINFKSGQEFDKFRKKYLLSQLSGNRKREVQSRVLRYFDLSIEMKKVLNEIGATRIDITDPVVKIYQSSNTRDRYTMQAALFDETLILICIGN